MMNKQTKVTPGATKSRRAKVDATAQPDSSAPVTLAKAIEVRNACTHNLKHVDVSVELGKLTVVSGVSGSGKSSLAFDTLFAEGQRRYVESLSTYARQFVGKMPRPDVDSIRNIPPAIAIEQKNSVTNARSTIGTATEILDYLRLLFSRAGRTYCPTCNLLVEEDTPASVTEKIIAGYAGRRMYIVAPVSLDKKSKAQDVLTEIVRAGYSRIFVPPSVNPGGRLFVDAQDDEPSALALLRSGKGGILVDRLKVDVEDRDRLSQSLSAAFQAGKGTAETWMETDVSGELEKKIWLSGFRCNVCGASFDKPEANMFSFNSPIGACPTCTGFGRIITIDWNKVIPNRHLSLSQEPIDTFNTPAFKKNYKWFLSSCKRMKLSLTKPLDEFTPEEFELMLNGKSRCYGLQAFFDEMNKKRYSMIARILVARYRGFVPCPDCHGHRLVSSALNVRWGLSESVPPMRNIAQFCEMSINDLSAEWLMGHLTAAEDELFGRIYREIGSRLGYLMRVGLGYLTLNRQTRTLSGGEAQRINLATALGTALTRTLYVLDEPTVGLHPRDSKRLLSILYSLRDRDNTIVVVEHDPEIILGADTLIDMGPKAGASGGQIMFRGSPSALADPSTVGETARCLRARGFFKKPGEKKKRERVTRNSEWLVSPGVIRVHGARAHNLKNISVDIPLNKMVVVTGVSGSGKTTLVHQVLYQGYLKFRNLPTEEMGEFDSIEGLDSINEFTVVDQASLSRSTRSNPVTYVKAYDPIRRLFAATRIAKSLRLTEGSFSFNIAGGRCEACKGTGVQTYDMHFLPEMTLPCEECGGKRFGPRVLEVQYKGKSIADVLDMTVDESVEFFSDNPIIVRRLRPLHDVGLGYLSLGQNTSTLSGGEAQRLKLASHLVEHGTGQGTLLVFDEPTTGLHLADLENLIGVFRRLVERGYSLIIIEHNLDVIRSADWIIDLGPEGGEDGGMVVAEGTPSRIAELADYSHTGQFLAEIL